ncbi:MAG: acyl-CoA thioesterase domain-containing protein [Polyangiales bacterium]
MADEGKTTRVTQEARAWVDDVLVAVSAETLRIDKRGTQPVLCFPKKDLHGTLPATGVLTSAPEGYVAFDTAEPRVRVMIVDRYPGDPEGFHNLVRFPTWGDATDLVAMLDVRAEGSDYLSIVRDNAANPHRDVVEASQILGQALVAAGRKYPDRRAVNASMAFLKVANTSEPLRVQLEEHSNGRQFTALGVKVVQAGKLAASGTMLLDVTAPDVMRHEEPAGTLSNPYDAVFYDMSMTGRDMRYVEGAYSNDPDAPVGPPDIDAWLRFRGVPEDRFLHQALLASFTGNASIAAAMRPHAGIGQSQAHRTLSTAINAITISFHADVRADQWLLYKHRSTFAGAGMTHSDNRVYDAKGKLLASFSVEAMVRAMPTSRAVNEKTAL